MIEGYNTGMFIRPCYRRKNGKRHAYWALMESYRTQRGPRQRIVAYLGQLDESHRLGVKNAAEGNPQARQQQLFDDTRPHWVEVDVKRMRVENCRDFGGPWLGLQQGQRSLTACSGKDLEHIVIVPTAGAAFHGHAVFLGMLLQQGQGEAIQPREVFTETLITDA